VVPPLDVRFNVEPSQMGELLVADGVGRALKVTVTAVLAELIQPVGLLNASA
jgi:hypothetical protein